MPKRKTFFIAVILLLILDGVVAYGFSSALTGRFLRLVNERVKARVVFSDVRVHPLFLSASARNIEVFDLDSPRFRVLSGESATAAIDPFALLFRRKIFLSSLRFKKFHLRAVQDEQGVLNLEKIFEPEAGRGFRDYFHGWKHQDWLFNAYARLKFAARNSSSKPPQGRPVFRIGSLELEDGLLILTDRRARATAFSGIDLQIKDVCWYPTGQVRMGEVSARGELATKRPGRFEIQVKRDRKEVRAFISVRTLDLTLVEPLYAKTSPVVFERGFLTWSSLTRITPQRVQSTHKVRIEDHRMRSVTGWSPESEAMLRALNRHKTLDLRFRMEGKEEGVSFEGAEESLSKILEHDFNAKTLRAIRLRVSQELNKLAARLT